MKVKVRYLAQGIIEIPAEDLPENFETMRNDKAWEWLLEWWANNVTQEMINRGIEDCDSGPEVWCAESGLDVIFPYVEE